MPSPSKRINDYEVRPTLNNPFPFSLFPLINIACITAVTHGPRMGRPVRPYARELRNYLGRRDRFRL